MTHVTPPGASPGHTITYWDNAGQARQAETELTPCGPLCVGVHSIVRVDIEVGR